MTTKCALPGFPPLADFMRELGKSPLTGPRWEREGRIVCVRLGRAVLVDVEATTARLREKTGPAERRGPSCSES
jgi:hypothetical protein